MTTHSSILDGTNPKTIEKTGVEALLHTDQEGPVVSAAKTLTTAYRRSTERLADARDSAVAAGKHNPVMTGFTVLAAGIGCGIGCGILFSNWVAGRRRDIAAKATTGSNHSHS